MSNNSINVEIKYFPGYDLCDSLLSNKGMSIDKVVRQLYQAIIDVVGGMKPGVKYKTEWLCGPEMWRQYPSKGMRRALGICLSMMVQAGLLPLKCVNPNRRTTKFYVLKG